MVRDRSNRGRKFRLREEHREYVDREIRRRYGTKAKWKKHVGIGRATIWRFLSCRAEEAISLEYFDRLCVSLGLIYEDVGEAVIESGESTERSLLPQTIHQNDVTAIRRLVRDKIVHLCSHIHIFTRSISIENYVDLSIFHLGGFLNERYGSISRERLHNEFTVDNYDRELGTIRNLDRVPDIRELEENFLLIYGWPGTGKTSCLKWLAMECSDGRYHSDIVPIFLESKNFSFPKFSLINEIHKFFYSYGIQDVQTLTLELLRAGKLLILIDGLDELEDNHIQPVCQNIQSVVNQFFKCRYIFSCRLPLLLRFERCKKLLVNGFNPKQRELFAKKWFAVHRLDDKLLRKFLLQLKGHPALNELTRTPLLMELLCQVFSENQEFPPTRGDLYEQGIENLIHKVYEYQEQRRVPFLFRQIKVEDVRRFFQLIATHYFTDQKGPRIIFDKEDILLRVREFFGPIVNQLLSREDSLKLLEAIELQFGLLVSHSRHCCVFSHLTFQEYFTAKFLSQNQQEQAVLSHLTEPKWRFVIELVSELLPRDRKEIFFNEFKQAVDSLVVDNPNLYRFIRWLDTMAVEVSDEHSAIAYRQPLLRAWYFSFCFQYVEVGNPGRLPARFTLPEFNRASSYLSSDTLRYHAQWYRAYHSTQSELLRMEFEYAIAFIHQSIKRNADITDTESLQLLNSLDSWKTTIATYQSQYNNPGRWWSARRLEWQDRIKRFMERHYGLQTHSAFTDNETQVLYAYYNASRLLSICAVRAGRQLSASYQQKLTESLLSLPFVP